MTKILEIERKDSYGVVYYDMVRKWEVQPKPYQAVLPFSYRESYRTSSYGFPGPYSPSAFDCAVWPVTSVKNSAYAALVNQLGDTATWANNLLEANQSISLIEESAFRLIKAARDIRRGNFSWAANDLFMNKAPRTKGRTSTEFAKNFGDNWLKFHFGWEPLVQDIGAAVNVLNKTDFGTRSIFGQASEPYQNNSWYYQDKLKEANFEEGKVSCKTGARCTVTNPNAFLANRMGFVNPLSVLWEAVPYSFVVDWFSNVGQIISSYTDFVGVSIDHSYTTTFQRAARTYSFSYPGTANGFQSTLVTCGRDGHIQGPVLTVKPFKGFSATRGATAISLLLQHLK